MDSSAQGVFDTYELLERILMAVPMKQLFVVRRVSKAWKMIIERLQVLQKKMFLLADGASLKPRTPQMNSRTLLEYEHNACLNPIFPAFCEHSKHVDAEEDKACAEIPFPGEYELCANQSKRMLVSLDLASAYDSLNFKQPSNDLRSMLLTQPPVTAVDYEFYEALEKKDQDAEAHAMDDLLWCTIYSTSGVTLGDLYDVHGASV